MSFSHFLCFSMIILFASCGTDKSTLTFNDISGTWSIASAKRDGKITRVLEGAYLSFLNDSLMNTNITGDTTDYKYTIKEQVIRQVGDPIIEYQLESLQGDSLILNSIINDTKYNFLFVKHR